MVFLFSIVGFVFLLLEMFFPGMIMASIGFLAFMASCLYLYAAGVSFPMILSLVFLYFGLFLVIFRYTLKKLARSKSNTFYLNEDQSGFKASMSSEFLMGKEGIACTELKLSGYITIDGNKYQALSDGEFISFGDEVVVIAAEGGHLVVRRKIWK